MTRQPAFETDFEAAPHDNDHGIVDTALDAAPTREITRKRRKGYPSESRVKRGRRLVHGDKELVEKLGRNDPCPCGSMRRFKELLPRRRAV